MTLLSPTAWGDPYGVYVLFAVYVTQSCWPSWVHNFNILDLASQRSKGVDRAFQGK
jgi:hypothetical protein